MASLSWVLWITKVNNCLRLRKTDSLTILYGLGKHTIKIVCYGKDDISFPVIIEGSINFHRSIN